MPQPTKHTLRHYYELMLVGGGNHKKHAKYHKFINAQSWAEVDYTGSPLRIAVSSLSLEEFRGWVASETGVKEGDIMVDEITSTSLGHDDRRKTIEKYFKVKL